MTSEPRQRQTSLLGKPDKSAAEIPEPSLHPSLTNPHLEPAPRYLLLQFGGPGKTVTTLSYEVKDKTLVGRSDVTANFMPDLDLTPFGGQIAGVSRKHAHVIKRDDGLYIEDLGSTNGSSLNQIPIEADRLYPLRDGDEIELGRLRIVMRFVNDPNY